MLWILLISVCVGVATSWKQPFLWILAKVIMWFYVIGFGAIFIENANAEVAPIFLSILLLCLPLVVAGFWFLYKKKRIYIYFLINAFINASTKYDDIELPMDILILILMAVCFASFIEIALHIFKKIELLPKNNNANPTPN